MLAEFRRRFWLPPRAHGNVIEDRTVSFLELFYDLVYVVVIARATHTLAEHIAWRTVGEFAVVFGLIWFAWLNGTLYYELHGREDGRTRLFVFVQMLMLALLAVFTADAGGDSGTQFALVYASYLAVVTWLWYTVSRQDSEEFVAISSRYLTAMVTSIAVIAVTAALPDDARIVVWAVFVVGWSIGMNLLNRMANSELVFAATDSMVERYGLFVIIVLGEVVVGVVDGLSEAEHTFRSIATGMLGLGIGFAYWWTYFDFVGRRLPRGDGPTITRWMTAHLPVTLSIAAAGAAMVSLIEHAAEDETPAATGWLLAGSIALGLVALIVNITALRDHHRLPSLYRPMIAAMAVAAGVSLLAASVATAPWLLALILLLTLVAVWLVAVDRWLRLDDPEQALPGTQ